MSTGSKSPWSIYSVDCPRCIGKGKAARPYGFGIKVPLTTTNRRRKGGQFIVQAKALPGNPYDSHTLKPVREETGELTGRRIERADVDKGCQGHDAPGAIQAFKSGHKRGVHGRIRKGPRRRSSRSSNPARKMATGAGTSSRDASQTR